MMMKGPYREIIPLGPQRVRVNLPAGRKPQKVQLLVSGGQPRVEESPGSVALVIPSIALHEAVAVEL